MQACNIELCALAPSMSVAWSCPKMSCGKSREPQSSRCDFGHSKPQKVQRGLIILWMFGATTKLWGRLCTWKLESKRHFFYLKTSCTSHTIATGPILSQWPHFQVVSKQQEHNIDYKRKAIDMKGVVSKGERQRVKWRHGPTHNKGTEEQGVKMRCSIQPLTVSIAMYVEWSEANLALYRTCSVSVGVGKWLW